MFAESLLETSWAERGRRSWTTLTSFGLQAAIIGLLLLIPLLATVGLPSARVLQGPVSWGTPPHSPHVVRPVVTTVVQSNLSDNVLIAPRTIPPHVRILNETEPPPQVSYNTDPGVEGGTGDGSRDDIWKALNESLNRAAPMPVAPPPSIQRAFRRSEILEGSLIRKVEPKYPPLAMAARIQGSVVLAAVISKVGTIDNLRLVSGHPMLVPAAIDAVRQWRYRPYILNGEVIEVDTQITVNFVLGGR